MNSLWAPIALGPTKASSEKTLQEMMLWEKSVINIENGFGDQATVSSTACVYRDELNWAENETEFWS